MYLFEGETADIAWQKASDQFRSGVGVSEQPSRAGSTKELLHCSFSIHNPRQRWVFSRKPPMNPAFAIAEVIWILSGSRDAAFINFWNPLLPRYAGKGDHYHGAYGYRLKRHVGIDQILRARDILEANPASRQVVLSIWDPRIDLPDSKGQPASADIPCNICSLLKVRDGRLEWLQLLRSNDLFLGVPHNFVQFTTLQEIMAGWLGLELGTYSHISDSLHIYVHDLPNLVASVAVVDGGLTNIDDLRLPFEPSQEIIRTMYLFLEECACSAGSSDKFRKALIALELPTPFRNLALICAADAARRHGWPDLGQELGNACSNLCLKHLWLRWSARWSAREKRPG